MSTSQQTLKTIARARLADAQVLLKAKRYDGAVYLCGYAVELALKARVVRTLKWGGFPETGGEFKGFENLKTHNLETLLAFSGQQDRIRTRYTWAWSVVADWNPESRYKGVGIVTAQDGADMIAATRELMRTL